MKDKRTSSIFSGPRAAHTLLALLLTAWIIAMILALAGSLEAAAPQRNTGTIKGHVRLNGKSPGNTVIRMGVDPMCGRLNAGKRVLQEAVLTSPDGGLKNAFVKLVGTFPATPVPSTPVVIDQRGCIYTPRVIGMRVGQVLQIKNSDPLLHNLHSSSEHNGTFNVGQATAGLVYEFKPKAEDMMLRLKCDVHRWMNAYIGIVSNPYFAVSGDGGTFEIGQVPPGTYTLQAWHELYGVISRQVRVQAGAVATVDLGYTPSDKPAAAR